MKLEQTVPGNDGLDDLDRTARGHTSVLQTIYKWRVNWRQ